ncbi:MULTISPECIES: MarR family winged helix-turn-helix transcriptional regulator [Clostridium]|uniref:MarR family protein n=2 Tax=Clostridium TaxID=1485 RepID=D8GMA8_CLOLD|nr:MULTISPECIES: MarR family transcriptional regulator [Clostridium]ADK13518.1 predicted transcriptional regulator, marR family [Clostridium ljungdahlii DSM 13528]AGY76713.1 MarR family transcriptional regulator [Clostridium autoethanogenum DSM 10061]ALU36868.1 Transcriptional regulator MarR family [Clostridium autoethanogenum DSM 10061]OAA89136.1 MarR family protein [Clostridium ljungdahlii DSM 13528]OVY50442.1 MarR family protein [Clostridium autoethanogenum]
MITIPTQKNLPPRNDELILEQSDKIINLFKSIHKIIGHKFREIAGQYGFTVPQLAVIVHLYKKPGMTLNELSNHLLLAKSTVSGIIDRLVNQGIVTREIPENNRRIVKLSISEKFKKSNDIVNIRQVFISNCISDTIRNMDNETVDQFIHALEHYKSLLEDLK